MWEFLSELGHTPDRQRHIIFFGGVQSNRHVEVTPRHLHGLLGGLLTVTFLLGVGLASWTPLGYIVAGQNHSRLEEEIVLQAQHIDSLQQQLTLQTEYVNRLRTLMVEGPGSVETEDNRLFAGDSDDPGKEGPVRSTSGSEANAADDSEREGGLWSDFLPELLSDAGDAHVGLLTFPPVSGGQ